MLGVSKHMHTYIYCTIVCMLMNSTLSKLSACLGIIRDFSRVHTWMLRLWLWNLFF